jgi:hypothetical protein
MRPRSRPTPDLDGSGRHGGKITPLARPRTSVDRGLRVIQRARVSCTVHELLFRQEPGHWPERKAMAARERSGNVRLPRRPVRQALRRVGQRGGALIRLAWIRLGEPVLVLTALLGTAACPGQGTTGQKSETTEQDDHASGQKSETSSTRARSERGSWIPDSNRRPSAWEGSKAPNLDSTCKLFLTLSRLVASQGVACCGTESGVRGGGLPSFVVRRFGLLEPAI